MDTELTSYVTDQLQDLYGYSRVSAEQATRQYFKEFPPLRGRIDFLSDHQLEQYVTGAFKLSAASPTSSLTFAELNAREINASMARHPSGRKLTPAPSQIGTKPVTNSRRIR
jgi:hypothetical protein